MGGFTLSDLDIDLQMTILQRAANKTLNMQMKNILDRAACTNYAKTE